jgi:S-adenosylhomocysteine hydrolase
MPSQLLFDGIKRATDAMVAGKVVVVPGLRRRGQGRASGPRGWRKSQSFRIDSTAL